MRAPRRHRDDRARYWGHMLDTLKRTIDEIYTACEEDESEVECREVILILEHSKKDFHSLIEKMNLLRNYENADVEHRPTSLAWDERKTSPGKPIMKQVLLERTLSAAAVKAAAVAASGSPTTTLTLTSVSSPVAQVDSLMANGSPTAALTLASMTSAFRAPAELPQPPPPPIPANGPINGGGGSVAAEVVSAEVSNGQALATWADRVRGSAAKPPRVSAPPSVDVSGSREVSFPILCPINRHFTTLKCVIK